MDFWFKLLVAGSKGVALVEDMGLLYNRVLQERQYYVPDKNKVLSQPCILYYKGKVYFISSFNREMNVPLVLKAYERQVRSSSAEVERLSAEVKTLWPLKQAREKEKLMKEEEKLATTKERIVKNQECMSNKLYETYGPL